MYKNIKSLSCLSEADIILYVNYNSVKKKKISKLREDTDLRKAETGHSLIRKQSYTKKFPPTA